MKDFGRWFKEFLPTPAPTPEPVPEKEYEGLYQYGEHEWTAVCRMCEREYVIGCDPDEFDQAYSYCGGSPRCCP